ncbi:MAG: hypothetical protein ACLUE8_08370 [Lachnospiraceae bacterium]
MTVKIIGLIVGLLVLGAGLYYLVKEKKTRNPARSTAWSARWAACS